MQDKTPTNTTEPSKPLKCHVVEAMVPPGQRMSAEDYVQHKTAEQLDDDESEIEDMSIEFESHIKTNSAKSEAKFKGCKLDEATGFLMNLVTNLAASKANSHSCVTPWFYRPNYQMEGLDSTEFETYLRRKTKVLLTDAQ